MSVCICEFVYTHVFDDCVYVHSDRFETTIQLLFFSVNWLFIIKSEIHISSIILISHILFGSVVTPQNFRRWSRRDAPVADGDRAHSPFQKLGILEFSGYYFSEINSYTNDVFAPLLFFNINLSATVQIHKLMICTNICKPRKNKQVSHLTFYMRFLSKRND